MSEEGTESTKQTLDLVIVNSNISELNDGIIIRWYLSNYGLTVNFNLTIREDELLYDTPTFERFPNDAVVYTHLAANSNPNFVTLLGVHKLTEDSMYKSYRPDLRFIISFDQKYLDEITFIEYCRDNSDLFNYLQRVSKNELDPANIVSCTFKRDWTKFFTNEKEDSWGDYFKDYVEKLLKIRAGLREGQTQASIDIK